MKRAGNDYCAGNTLAQVCFHIIMVSSNHTLEHKPKFRVICLLLVFICSVLYSHFYIAGGFGG